MYVYSKDIYNTHCILMNKITMSRGGKKYFKGIRIDLITRRILGPKGGVELTSYEFQILWLVIRAQGALITENEISYFIFEGSDKDIPLSNSIGSLINKIRKKLKEVSNEVTLINERELGYGIEAMPS